VRDIVQKYTTKYPGGVVMTIDCEEEKAATTLQTALTNRGLFAKAALILLVNPAEATKELIRILKGAATTTEVTVLVSAAKKLPKDFAFLYAEGVGPKKQSFDELEGKELLSFLKSEAAALGYLVSDETVRAVSQLHGGDTWAALTELARASHGGVVGGAQPSIDFVAAMGALMNGARVEQRLRALFLLLESEDPAKIFNMAGGWARGGGKVRMADYDIAVKSGTLEYSEALLDYVLATP
jgi:hypothetical protein